MREIAAGLLLVALCASTASAASFEDVGGTFGGGIVLLAGMSGDGQTLVGRTTGTIRAVRWRAATGWVDLGTLPGNTSTRARAASFDGSVIAGNGDASHGMRFVEGSGWEALDLPFDGSASAVSADGSSVGGWYFFGSEFVQLTGLLLWEEGQGTTAYEQTGADSSIRLDDLTADGSVMLGTRSYLYGSIVVRVTQAGTTTFPPTDPQNVACIDLCGAEGQAISADGSTIVGGVTLDAFSFAPLQAARWSGADPPLALGFLDPPAAEPTSVAHDVSGDGALVVGESDGRAFVWTQLHGMRDLAQALEASGLDLDGWTLTSARAISTDGSVIAGTGTNPAGDPSIWRAVAPGLGATPAPALSGLALGALALTLALAAARALRAPHPARTLAHAPATARPAR